MTTRQIDQMKFIVSETDTMRKLCIDPGFGGIKGAEVQNGKLQTYFLPAQVGLNRSTENLSLGGIISTGVRTEKPLRVTLEDGTAYLVGHNVNAYADSIYRPDLDRFSESQELRAGLYAMLYRMLGPGSHEVGIVLTLPVEVVPDNETANIQERLIRKWLVTDHKFTVEEDDHTCRLNVSITRARCKMPQPVSIWCNWGFDNRGQWMHSKEAFSAPYLIIDPGFNTFDIILIAGREIQSRISGGETLGMRVAAKRAAKLLKDKHGLNLDVYEADQLIQDLTAKGKAQHFLGGEMKDFSAECRQALNSLQADILNYVEDAARQAAAYKNLLAGGGAIPLEQTLRRHFPNLEVFDSPVMAGASGGAKIAARKGYLQD